MCMCVCAYILHNADKQLPLLNGPDFVTVPAFQESQFKLSALVNDFRQSAVTYGAPHTHIHTQTQTQTRM